MIRDPFHALRTPLALGVASGAAAIALVYGVLQLAVARPTLPFDPVACRARVAAVLAHVPEPPRVKDGQMSVQVQVHPWSETRLAWTECLDHASGWLAEIEALDRDAEWNAFVREGDGWLPLDGLRGAMDAASCVNVLAASAMRSLDAGRPAEGVDRLAEALGVVLWMRDQPDLEMLEIVTLSTPIEALRLGLPRGDWPVERAWRELVPRLDALADAWERGRAREAPRAAHAAVVGIADTDTQMRWQDVVDALRCSARLGELALAVDLFRLEHGRWPATLAELGGNDRGRAPSRAGCSFALRIDGAAVELVVENATSLGEASDGPWRWSR